MPSFSRGTEQPLVKSTINPSEYANLLQTCRVKIEKRWPHLKGRAVPMAHMMVLELTVKSENERRKAYLSRLKLQSEMEAEDERPAKLLIGI